MVYPRFNPAPLARRLLIAAVCSAVAVIGLSSPATGAAAEPEYAVVREKIKTIKAVDSFKINAPDFAANVWVLIAAQPPELASQSDTSAHLMPGGKPIKDLTAHNRPLLRSQIPVTTASLEHALGGRAEYRATLYRRDLVRREPDKTYPPAEKLSKTERTASLAETPSLDFSAEVFQHWLNDKELRKKPDEADLDFARRVFLAITHAYGYQYSETMDRHASVLCRQDKADCGGMWPCLPPRCVPTRFRCGCCWGIWRSPRIPSAAQGEGCTLLPYQGRVLCQGYWLGAGRSVVGGRIRQDAGGSPLFWPRQRRVHHYSTWTTTWSMTPGPSRRENGTASPKRSLSRRRQGQS